MDHYSINKLIFMHDFLPQKFKYVIDNIAINLLSSLNFVSIKNIGRV